MRRGGAVAALLAALVLAVFPRGPERPAVAQSSKPNIVVIITDDQSLKTMRVMHATRRLIGRPGVVFKNGFVSNPQCCPSRATLLTGKYSHGTNIYKNAPPFGGFTTFKDDSTIATWLDDAGYRTGLIGKYMNGYLKEHANYEPPGWDRWVALLQREKHMKYFGYNMVVDGRRVHYGKDPSQYITDVLGSYATQFIQSSPDPFFLYFNPNAPHAPSTPAPRHRDTFRSLKVRHAPSFNERNVRDKPKWVRDIPRLSPRLQRRMDKKYIHQLKATLALDEAVARLVRTLKRKGELRDTFILFMSDNGYLFGEHRWDRKQVAYEESIRVPFMVRYDPLVTRPRWDHHLVTNLDLAPTLADLAGVEAPGAEGRSLLPLLQDPSTDWRTDFALEHVFERAGPPTYCGLRTREQTVPGGPIEEYTYVLYETDEEELYDLKADPHQLHNRADDPDLAPLKARLRLRTAQLCFPAPPGMEPF